MLQHIFRYMLFNEFGLGYLLYIHSYDALILWQAVGLKLIWPLLSLIQSLIPLCITPSASTGCLHVNPKHACPNVNRFFCISMVESVLLFLDILVVSLKKMVISTQGPSDKGNYFLMKTNMCRLWSVTRGAFKSFSYNTALASISFVHYSSKSVHDILILWREWWMILILCGTNILVR